MKEFLRAALLLSLALITSARASAASIVSLAPSLTEIVFALGKGTDLVGVTTYCDYPTQARSLAKIGDFSNPNTEVILAKKPTIVLATEGNSRAVLNRLKGAGIEILETHPKSAAQLPDVIRKIAKKLDAKDAGEQLATSLERGLADLRKHGQAQRSASPRVLVALSLNPIVSVTEDSWLGDLLKTAGLTNVVPAGKIAYPQLSAEFVLQAKPDILVLDPMLTQAAAGSASVDPSIEQLVKSALGHPKSLPKIVVLPPDVLMRPGPRLLEGMTFLRSINK